MNSKLENILKSFDRNQLREINNFLNSSKGKNLKSQLNDSEKAKLMREFEKLDSEEVKRRLRGMNTKDIMKIISSL